MTKLYIYHHLGLGDHIICNAVVRHYSKLYDRIYLFVKPHNYKNVSFMYRDLSNIYYIQGDDNDCNNYIIFNNITPLKIGFDKLIRNINFDHSFYEQLNINFEKKWKDFYIERNFDKEKQLYNELINNEKYIFVHDDKDRNFSINDCLINKKIKIVRPSTKFDFFDYCYIIENAEEIHLMESSYKCLVEHLNLKTSNLFYHTYIRNYPKNIRVTSKYKWIEY